ncbi:MAG: hypothetical protein WCQ50_00810 [Spirochaetota bacterium]
MRPLLRGSRACLIVVALATALALPLAAQDSGAAADTQAGSEAELFGAETVTETKSDTTATPQKDFLKYDVVKVGGLASGSLGLTGTWLDPWKAGIDPLKPDSRRLTPSLSDSIKITAKPSEDFGVNMEFRTSNPFASSTSVLTGASYRADNPFTPTLVDPGVTTTSTTLTLPSIKVWLLYSKFSWHDAVFMSFGKQSLAWGVSQSFFQPANDIFALNVVDFSNTGAEREGPIAFKAQYPLPFSMANAYFYAGVPDTAALDINDLRVAAKAEGNFGTTELAAAGYYSYNDHPRGILMGTTGNGTFNFFGEAVGKWGSERYFLSSPILAAQKADQLWFSGTAGGYYSNSDWYLTASAAYFYNGEGQSGVTAKEAYAYYYVHQSEIDRAKFGTHYAAASISFSQLFVEQLSFMVYGVGNISDRSFIIAPSLTWKFFDYMKAKTGATLSFGPEGSEYTLMGGGKPSASFSLSLDLGSGSF